MESLSLLLPLACIWFGDEMGDYIGMLPISGITKPTPGGFSQIRWLVPTPHASNLLVACFQELSSSFQKGAYLAALNCVASSRFKSLPVGPFGISSTR